MKVPCVAAAWFPVERDSIHLSILDFLLLEPWIIIEEKEHENAVVTIMFVFCFMTSEIERLEKLLLKTRNNLSWKFYVFTNLILKLMTYCYKPLFFMVTFRSFGRGLHQNLNIFSKQQKFAVV